MCNQNELTLVWLWPTHHTTGLTVYTDKGRNVEAVHPFICLCERQDVYCHVSLVNRTLGCMAMSHADSDSLQIQYIHVNAELCVCGLWWRCASTCSFHAQPLRCSNRRDLLARQDVLECKLFTKNCEFDNCQSLTARSALQGHLAVWIWTCTDVKHGICKPQQRLGYIMPACLCINRLLRLWATSTLLWACKQPAFYLDRTRKLCHLWCLWVWCSSFHCCYDAAAVTPCSISQNMLQGGFTDTLHSLRVYHQCLAIRRDALLHGADITNARVDKTTLTPQSAVDPRKFLAWQGHSWPCFCIMYISTTSKTIPSKSSNSSIRSSWSWKPWQG